MRGSGMTALWGLTWNAAQREAALGKQVVELETRAATLDKDVKDRQASLDAWGQHFQRLAKIIDGEPEIGSNPGAPIDYIVSAVIGRLRDQLRESELIGGSLRRDVERLTSEQTTSRQRLVCLEDECVLLRRQLVKYEPITVEPDVGPATHSE